MEYAQRIGARIARLRTEKHLTQGQLAQAAGVPRDALAREAKDSTKLIVAQRIGTIMNADRIVVLDDGKVVGQGTHKELLDNCDVYRQIAESQLSQSELTA